MNNVNYGLNNITIVIKFEIFRFCENYTKIYKSDNIKIY